MVDYIAGLALKAGGRFVSCYYNNVRRGEHSSKGLAESIQGVEGTPVITEVKFASPSAGRIREHVDPLWIARAMLKGGACAIAVVLIGELFSRGLAERPLDRLVREASRLGLEVLLEANSPEEFRKLPEHKPDLYGINNRNLSTFQLDLSTTERVLAMNGHVDRPVVSESGIENPRDIVRLKNAGAEAFLVGTSIMMSPDVESKVQELVKA